VAERSITHAALEFAAVHHAGQRRESDQEPFILHPVEVARLLRDCDYPDHVVAAGVLHDVIENTPVGLPEIEARFGSAVAELVRTVSEPTDEGAFADRKARLREVVAAAGPDAMAVFAADKVAKVRELRLAGAGVAADKEAHYRASLVMLEQRLPAHPLVRQLRLELEALATSRTTSRAQPQERPTPVPPWP
jgi:(p)ppGpp synthase/HD superfamily hydrolase